MIGHRLPDLPKFARTRRAFDIMIRGGPPDCKRVPGGRVNTRFAGRGADWRRRLRKLARQIPLKP
jgi:hypothetical protein